MVGKRLAKEVSEGTRSCDSARRYFISRHVSPLLPSTTSARGPRLDAGIPLTLTEAHRHVGPRKRRRSLGWYVSILRRICSTAQHYAGKKQWLRPGKRFLFGRTRTEGTRCSYAHELIADSGRWTICHRGQDCLSEAFNNRSRGSHCRRLCKYCFLEDTRPSSHVYREAREHDHESYCKISAQR